MKETWEFRKWVGSSASALLLVLVATLVNGYGFLGRCVADEPLENNNQRTEKDIEAAGELSRAIVRKAWSSVGDTPLVSRVNARLTQRLHQLGCSRVVVLDLKYAEWTKTKEGKDLLIIAPPSLWRVAVDLQRHRGFRMFTFRETDYGALLRLSCPSAVWTSTPVVELVVSASTPGGWVTAVSNDSEVGDALTDLTDHYGCSDRRSRLERRLHKVLRRAPTATLHPPRFHKDAEGKETVSVSALRYDGDDLGIFETEWSWPTDGEPAFVRFRGQRSFHCGVLRSRRKSVHQGKDAPRQVPAARAARHRGTGHESGEMR